jgi:DNA-binding transcriptional LysR family regulator
LDTLTRMRAYKDVVEAEGYSAAARRIGRSKALLSKYVRELEDELSTLLINRTTRQFSLTEAGHAYYGRVVEILRDIDDLQDSVRQNSGDISGRIRLTAPRTLADSFLGQCMIDFAVANPEIILDVTLDDRFVDLVEEGFDMAIRIADLTDSALIAKRLGSFSMSVYAAPSLLERVGRPESPAALSRLPCVVDTNHRTRNVWNFLDAKGERYSVAVRPVIEANSPEVMRRAAVSGIGFAFVPDVFAAEDAAAGRIVAVFSKEVPNHHGIYAVYPHRRYLPQRVRTFVDFLASWMRRELPR